MLNAALTVGGFSTIERIGWMTEHGSSLILSYGEDTDAWEVAWISGGVQFLAYGGNLRAALLNACRKLDEREREDTTARKESV